MPPRTTGAYAGTTPTFYVTGRGGPRPLSILLAILVAAGAATGAMRIRTHAQARSFAEDRATSAARTNDPPGKDTPHDPKEDEDDDPSQVDTIVLGDAADAPVPARKHDRVSPVHATILIQLPRYGKDEGLIPDTPSGHLLFNWLAAFNQASSQALDKALPTERTNDMEAAQMALRLHTGGFRLVSAKEVQPGILVFRMFDQTPDGNEVLGTLQMRKDSNPPTIQTFSLREVPPRPKPTQPAAPSKQ